MDRPFNYIGQSAYEWQITAPAQAAMVGLGKGLATILGTATLANALPCAPTSPASLQVQMGAGEIYQLAALEATAMATLPADTGHIILKQGVNLDPVNLICSPPGTVGQSIAYLIEAQYQDNDVSVDPTTGSTNIVLSFFDASNPATPWSGPNNSAASSNTFRKGIVALQAKAGTAATTGTQVAPAADAGWVPLYVVTVANGQATITSGNIAIAPGAPFITETLTQKISQATGDGRYLKITDYQSGAPNYAIAAEVGGSPNVWTAALTPAPAALVDGMQVDIDFSATNTAAGPTLNLNGLGALTIYEADGATPLPIGLLPLNAILRYRSTSGGRWALISAAPITTGVVSFNTRTGAVTLTSGDVTTALGYTPLDAAGSVTGTAKITFFTSTIGSASINIPHGAVPTTLVNGDLWTTTGGVFARVNGSTQQLATATGSVASFNTRTGAVTLTSGDVTTALGYTPLNPAGGTMTGALNIAASGAGGAGVNLAVGTAPTTPNNGDLWITSGGIFAHVAGITISFIAGPTTTTSGDFVVWNSTTGSAVKDVAAAASIDLWTGTDNTKPLTSLTLANAGLEDGLVDGATVNWNMAQGFNANWTVAGNGHTLATPTGAIAGRTYVLRVIQGGAGSFTPVLPGCFDFGVNGTPAFSTTPGKRDAIFLYCETGGGSPNFIATFYKGS